MGRLDLVVMRIVVATVLSFAVVLLLSGCNGRVGMDNTASGGGAWGFDWSRCPVESQPIGGNAGNTGNRTTKGGGVSVDPKP